MDALDYLKLLRRGWRFLLLGLIIGGLAGWLVAPLTESSGPRVPTYEAARTIILRAGDASGTQGRNQTNPGLAQAVFLTRVGEVPQRVAARLGFREPAAILVDQITVQSDGALGTMVITARDDDPQRAADLANAFGEELVAYLIDRRENALQARANSTLARLEDLSGRIAALEERLARGEGLLVRAERDALVNQYRVTYELLQDVAAQDPAASSFVTVQEAMPVPVDDGLRAPASRFTWMLLGAGIGLVVGAAGVFLRDRFDTRVRTKPIAEAVFGLPVIAEVPMLSSRARSNEIMSLTEPASPYAEAHRAIRTAIMFVKRGSELPGTNGQHDGHGQIERNGTAVAGASSRLQVILVTSPGSREGKTTTVANLAASFAEMGQSVVVLSCDFRQPRVHRFLGGGEGPGLADVLRGSDVKASLTTVIRRTTIRDVALVPSAVDVDNPAELLAGAGEMIAAARGLADIVIIDTPPLLAANDARELMRSADVVVLAARAGKTTRESSQRATEVLERLNAPVLGVVLVAAPRVPTTRRYYYRYQRSRGGLLGWREWFRRGRRVDQEVQSPQGWPVPTPTSMEATAAPVSTPPTDDPAARNGRAGRRRQVVAQDRPAGRARSADEDRS